MFYDPDKKAVNYFQGSPFNVPERTSPLNEGTSMNNQLYLALYTTVRANCNTACSRKHLADLPEEEQTAYIENAKTAQNNLKKINNTLSREFESCIRGCFGNKKLKILFSYSYK